MKLKLLLCDVHFVLRETRHWHSSTDLHEIRQTKNVSWFIVSLVEYSIEELVGTNMYWFININPLNKSIQVWNSQYNNVFVF